MLRFLGVGSAFNTKLGNTSAWMKLESHLLIVDCGGSVFGSILERGLLKDIAALDICLTHTHGDHIGSLSDLVLYCHYILGIKPTLRHPDGDRIRALMTLLGVPEEVYTLSDAVTFSLDNILEARFVKQVHADTMPAYGLLFRNDGRTGWYSGDSRGIPIEILESFLKGEIDIFYQDTSGTDYPDSLHMSLDHLKNLIPEALRRRVVCMHQDESFNPGTAAGFGFCTAQINGDPSC